MRAIHYYIIILAINIFMIGLYCAYHLYSYPFWLLLLQLVALIDLLNLRRKNS